MANEFPPGYFVRHPQYLNVLIPQQNAQAPGQPNIQNVPRQPRPAAPQQHGAQVRPVNIIQQHYPIVSTLSEFDPHEGKFSTWYQLFQEYCFVNNIPEEPPVEPGDDLPAHNRKRALFLSHLGLRTLEILNKKVAPGRPNQFPVVNLAATLTQHFERPELQSTYRYQFSNRIQNLNESVTDYATELQDLGSKCGFGQHLDERLRDRFVSGAVLPQEVRTQLTRNPRWTFDEQLDYVIQSEQLAAQARMYARNLQLQQVTVAAVQQQFHPPPVPNPATAQQLPAQQLRAPPLQARQHPAYNQEHGYPQFNAHPQQAYHQEFLYPSVPGPQSWAPQFPARQQPPLQRQQFRPQQRQQTDTPAPRGPAPPPSVGQHPDAQRCQQAQPTGAPQEQCQRCGVYHDHRTCSARNMTCRYCNRLGHMEKMCYARQRAAIHHVRERCQRERSSEFPSSTPQPTTPSEPNRANVLNTSAGVSRPPSPSADLPFAPSPSAPVYSAEPQCTQSDAYPFPLGPEPEEEYLSAILARAQAPTYNINTLIELPRDKHPNEAKTPSSTQPQSKGDDTSPPAPPPQAAPVNESRLETLEVRASPPEIVQVCINNQEFGMEFDGGATVSILPYATYIERLSETPLQPASIKLASMAGGIQVRGAIQVTARIASSTLERNLPLIVAEAPPGFIPLLGRDWLDELIPQWRSALRASVPVYSVTTSIIDELKGKYAPIFDPHNDEPIRVEKVSLITKPDFQPIFHKAYPVPFAKIASMDRIIDDLVAKGHLYPVRFSRVASPVVLVLKKTGDDRMCADVKRTINDQLESDVYRLPVPSEIFTELAHGACFTVLDLSNAYLQLEIDEPAQELLTINTHRGLFRYRRLIYGVKPAANIFQRTMDSIVAGIPDVCCYIDDILIKGKDFNDCFRTTVRVLDRLLQYNVRLKADKCIWFEPEVEYLGHIISSSGRRPATSKVECIRRLKTPTCVKEVRHILGVLEFYAQYFAHASTILKPLSSLTKANTPFIWDEPCERALQLVKDTIAEKILIHYDPTLPLLLMTDASPVGLGLALCHAVQEGEKTVEKPILFGSCTLSDPQTRYSQVDREALAVIFGLKKCHKFLYGRRFRIVTDNAAIAYIFNPNKPLPAHSANRLLNWAYILAAYDYEIVHRKAALLAVPDALSRLPSSGIINDVHQEMDLGALPLTAFDIAQATASDPLLAKVIEIVIRGWPDTEAKLPDDVKPFFRRRNDLTLAEGCLLVANRVFIPSTLRAHVLKLLHKGHPGKVRSKMLARRIVYWFGISTDIDTACDTCTPCRLENAKPTPEMAPWPEAKSPFERVHMDFCQLNRQTFFVFVDAYSRWVHAALMTSTTASAVTAELHTLFSIWGNPHLIVADNGPPFDSQEFKDFCTSRNIALLHSPPYHPQSNGLGERAVQTVKKGLRKLYPTPDSEVSPAAHRALERFLEAYRNIPSVATGKSPNEMLLTYTPRTTLTQLHPIQHGSNRSLETQDPFRENDLVIVKAGSRQPAITARVVRRLSATRYLVSAHGVFKKPHINQMSHAALIGAANLRQ